jgi:hypothetical protein
MDSFLSKFILAILILVLAFHCPRICRADNQGSSPDGYDQDYRFNFGIAFKNIELDISDTDTIETVALLEGDYIPWPYLNFRSPTRYFEGSRFGWLMEYGLSGFSIHKQSDPFTETAAKDRGTSAKGWFLYAVPTLTWDASQNLKIGLGLGGGILSAKGDALIYDPFPAITRIDYDFSQLAYGGYFLTEYVLGNFMFGVHAGVLIAMRDPYDYTISDGSVILAYRRAL